MSELCLFCLVYRWKNKSLLCLTLPTLVYRIDLQAQINVQEGKFLKNIKRAGQNRRAGGKFFSKSINVQTQIRPYRGDFFLKINKRACTSIRHTRVLTLKEKFSLRKDFRPLDCMPLSRKNKMKR